jgi:hypothetical protein
MVVSVLHIFELESLRLVSHQKVKWTMLQFKLKIYAELAEMSNNK